MRDSCCHSCTFPFRVSACLPVWERVGAVIGTSVVILEAAAQVKGGADAGLPVLLLLLQDSGLEARLSALHL